MQYFGFDRPSFALRALGFGDNFDPLELFKGGKQGVWYDPSDKSTLFQDVAGTVPVTKDGDPVGLMLDKSQGLGVNLWSDINVSIVNNNNNSTGTMGAYKDLRMINTASSGLGYPRFSFNIGLEVGKRYYVKGVLKGNLSKLASIRLSTSGSTSVVSFNTLTGEFIGCVVAESTVLQVATNLSIDEYLEISSIEIREAKGNHATQSISAARPLYKTDGVFHWFDTDGIDDWFKTNYTPSADWSSHVALLVGKKEFDTFVFESYNLAANNYVTFRDNTIKALGAPKTSTTTLEYIPNNTAFVTSTNTSGDNIGAAMAIACRDTNTSQIAFFNGRIYGFIIRHGTATVADISLVEQYLAKKSGVTL